MLLSKNTLEQPLSISLIFEKLHKLRNALPLGITQDISRYNDKEKASYLDNFCTYFNGLSIYSRHEKIQKLYNNIYELKTEYGLTERDLLESRYIGISSRETLEVAGIVGEIMTQNTPANDNPTSGEKLPNKSLSDILGILGLIKRFSGVNSLTRGDFIQKLKELDAQGKLGPEIYAEKYKLTMILEIPELSTWEIIFSGLELKYPHEQWINKAA